MPIWRYVILCMTAIRFIQSTCVDGTATSPCFTCYRFDGELCDSCVAGYGLPDGYYNEDCIKCPEGQYTNLAREECVSSCDEGEFVSLDLLRCTTGCKPNEYKNKTHCLSCEASIPNCAACSSESVCAICKSGYLSLDSTKCGSDCNSGEMKDHQARVCKKVYNSFSCFRFIVGAIFLILVLLF